MARDDFERWFQREMQSLRKAIPKRAIGKKRPKVVRMPSEMIDRRSHPDYRSGPVVRYHISELQGRPQEEENAMQVVWFVKGAKRPDRLTVNVNEHYVYLSADLRTALQAEDDSDLYVKLGTLDGRLAIARTDASDRNGWRVKAGGQLAGHGLMELLASHGFAQGRYVMEWNQRLGCYLSTRRDELQKKRRRAS